MQLVTREDVVALYQEIVDGLNRELSQYERIKRIAILPNEFSMDSGELTPTLKVKRKVVEEKYRDVIGQLYLGVADTTHGPAAGTKNTGLDGLASLADERKGKVAP